MVQRSVQQRGHFFLPSLWRPEELLLQALSSQEGSRVHLEELL